MIDAEDEVGFTDIYVDDDIVERVTDVLRSTRYVKGPELASFESAFADACGVDHAVGVNSGTAAILLSLQAAGVGPGDEVFVPGNTFFATASPVLNLGATPVFVDVDPETYTMDPKDFAAKAEDAENPTAVVPVHIYGHLVDVEAVLAVAADYDLAVIEDACQAHFAERDGHVAGTVGDAGAFSFYPSKNMTVAGDGGMLVTDDDELAATARQLRNHGRDESGTHQSLGLNHRLDEVKAAVGNEQLRHIDDWNEARNSAAQQYTDRLATIPEVTTPHEADDAFHVYHLYVIQVPAEERDEFREYLDERGIQTSLHYETPLHEHPVMVERVGETTLPVTEELYERIVSLPMHPRITDDELDRVCAAIEDYFETEACEESR
ncbi:dTDP-4-amino-4,6-dideoxygalactose transaminase [Halogranum amylolyticum]|uniref:dTDP-4-amino-4,6-dideoxygalactose transaminase n=1 Tax=Halogranum amylolyticum TaxID=660520 RepID=A0A1H8WN81_9EURY|nr:DegT/DnrJ/EryC1/StrS family aminotransferase [Halogranum amylolyticum]SEP29069.1 dTDP-4-amino-4,6-dideoxygalactose transaminase [Halogranum amylolyticum]